MHSVTIKWRPKKYSYFSILWFLNNPLISCLRALKGWDEYSLFIANLTIDASVSFWSLHLRPLERHQRCRPRHKKPDIFSKDFLGIRFLEIWGIFKNIKNFLRIFRRFWRKVVQFSLIFSATLLIMSSALQPDFSLYT